MVPIVFSNIEQNFNIILNEKQSRIDFLKNSPTSFYLLLFMDEILFNPDFNYSTNQNGVLMFDSILSFGLFNDIYHYCDDIDFKKIYHTFDDFEIFDKEKVLTNVNLCKNFKESNNEK